MATDLSNHPLDHARRVAPKAVLFDAYGTLFDVYSIAQQAETLLPGLGARLATVWRDKQIEYTRLVTTSNHGAHYRPFSELTRAALEFAIELVAPESMNSVTNGQKDQKIDVLMASYWQLQAFADSRATLAALKARGVVTGILSNGDLPMLRAAVESAGLADLLDHIISVDPIRVYKTHPDAYALGEQATGLQARDIGFVSCNSWDALAATWYGYTTLWVNRQNAPFEKLGTQPHHIGTQLSDVHFLF